MEEIVIRGFHPDDENFIVDSWLRSYHGHSFFTKHIPRRVFFEKHTEIVKVLLRKAEVLVAADPADPRVITGYVVFAKKNARLGTFHYVYVKESFRGLGICKQLIFETGLDIGTRVTHLTMKGTKILLKMGYVYCPYFH